MLDRIERFLYELWIPFIVDLGNLTKSSKLVFVGALVERWRNLRYIRKFLRDCFTSDEMKDPALGLFSEPVGYAVLTNKDINEGDCFAKTTTDYFTFETHDLPVAMFTIDDRTPAQIEALFHNLNIEFRRRYKFLITYNYYEFYPFPLFDREAYSRGIILIVLNAADQHRRDKNAHSFMPDAEKRMEEWKESLK